MSRNLRLSCYKLYANFHVHPPKVIKKPQFSRITPKFADHFPIRPAENGTPQIYSEFRKIRSIHSLLVRITRYSRNPHQFHTLLYNSCPIV